MQNYSISSKHKPWLANPEQGQSLVEYGLIVALVAVVTIPSLTFMGQQVSGMMSNLALSINIKTNGAPNAMASGVIPTQNKITSMPTSTANTVTGNSGPLVADTSVGTQSAVSSTVAGGTVNAGSTVNTATAPMGSLATLSTSANTMPNSTLKTVTPTITSSPSNSSTVGVPIPSTNMIKSTTTTAQPVPTSSFGALGTFSSFSSIQSSQQAVQVNGSMATEELAAFNAASVGGGKP